MPIQAQYLGMPLSLDDLEVENLAFFKHCAEHDFHLQACADCNLLRYPPTTACPWCMSRETKWVPVEGKGAVHSYTRQLAIELAPEVRVNSVAPGRTVTGMTEHIYRELGGGDLEAGMKKAGEEVMLGRVAMPDELAASICFLLSDDASYVTAHCLVVDGGFTAD